MCSLRSDVARDSLREFRRPEDGLPVGTLVIERYVYTNPNGKTGVQWLAQIVDKDGDLALMKACRTRREALGVASHA
jgi:hypothetical protein